MKKSFGPKPLIYPTPVLVIGTYDKKGRPNIMTVAWGGVCCSRPPSAAISLRKATYTYGNIIERQAFTINIPSEDYVKEADYAGIVSGRTEDKFASLGLTPVKGDYVDAPIVKEFPLSLECKLIHTTEIGRHTQFIGEILDVKADNAVLNEQGLPDIAKVKPFIYTPETQCYYRIGSFIGKAYTIGKKL